MMKRLDSGGKELMKSMKPVPALEKPKRRYIEDEGNPPVSMVKNASSSLLEGIKGRIERFYLNLYNEEMVLILLLTIYSLGVLLIRDSYGSRRGALSLALFFGIPIIMVVGYIRTNGWLILRKFIIRNFWIFFKSVAINILYLFMTYMILRYLDIDFLIILTLIFNLLLMNLFIREKERSDIERILHNGESPGFVSPSNLSIFESIDSTNLRIDDEVERRLKSERLRTELITNISHDIRTPLTNIMNFSSIIEEEKKKRNYKDEIFEYNGIIAANAQRMKTLVDDLFTATKSATGNVPLEIRTLDFSEILMQVFAPMYEEYRKKNMELMYNAMDRKVLIECDGNSISRAVQNLLVNALKYSLPGSRVYVKVTELIDEKDQGRVLVTFQNVSEHMLDITPDELMEQFVRGDRSRKTEGSGLGLYIASNLIRNSRGQFALRIEGDLFTAEMSLPQGKDEEFNN